MNELDKILIETIFKNKYSEVVAEDYMLTAIIELIGAATYKVTLPYKVYVVDTSKMKITKVYTY